MYFRNLGWISYKVGGGKIGSINTFWPIGKKNEPVKKVWGDTPEEAKKNYEEFMNKLKGKK